MSQRYLLATFSHEDDLLAATTAVRGKGMNIVDAFTPFPVHGLDRAMGLNPSRLTWVCFICGMIGVTGMLWFEHMAASVWWPIDVGGKPWNALPSDLPVAFEAAVLLGGFGSVFALFGVSRLYPGKQPRTFPARTTDDQFVLVIDETGTGFNIESVEAMLVEFNAVAVQEHVQNEGAHA